MKILKLLKKAKDAHDSFLLPSFVYRSDSDAGKWIADARLGNKKGKCERFMTVHDSIDAAIAELNKYPAREGSVIIVDDWEADL